MSNMTPDERAYFTELAADIVAHHGAQAAEAFKADPIGVVKAAHDRRQAAQAELALGRSERAKQFRQALAAEVYAECRQDVERNI